MLELVDPQSCRLFDLLTMHQVMLQDEQRMARFEEAVSRVVKEGDVVVDLGAGTGILSFLALKAGARKVYAVERTDVCRVAAEIAKDNGWDDRVVFVQADAREVTLPERADVVISETIGHMGLAEGFLDNMILARERFLKDGGTLIPQTLSVFAAPVECPEALASVSFWDGRRQGLDFSAARRHAANRVYIHRFRPEHLLAAPARLACLDLARLETSDLEGSLDFVMEREGVLHGVCGWFEARLAGDVSIDSSPFSAPTHWQQTFFPAWPPRRMSRREDLAIDFRFGKAGSSSAWTWGLPPGGESCAVF